MRALGNTGTREWGHIVSRLEECKSTHGVSLLQVFVYSLQKQGLHASCGQPEKGSGRRKPKCVF